MSETEQTIETEGQVAGQDQEDDGEYEASFKEFAEKRAKGEPINPLPDPLPEQAETVQASGTETAQPAETETVVVASELEEFKKEHPEFAELPETVLSNVKKLGDHAKEMQQKFTSATGRLMPMQKKVNELLRENNKIKSQEQVRKVATGDVELWGKFKKEYPDIAKAVESRFGSTEGPMPEVQKLSTRLSRLEQEEVERRRQAEYAALREAHTDFVEVVNSSKFQTWLFNQPEQVQSLIGSKRAADAAWLISTYKDHAGLAKPAPQEKPEKVVDVNAVLKRREKQLKTGETISSKPVGHAPSGDAGGFESAFKFFAAQKNQARKARGDRYF